MTIQVLNGANLGRLGLPRAAGLRVDDLRPAGRGAGADRARSWSSRWRSGRPTTRASCCAGCTRPATPPTRWCSTRRLVAHLGGAARRARRAQRAAGRGAHQQHPRARGVPAPLLRLRRRRRRHRRAGRGGLRPGAAVDGAAGESGEPRHAGAAARRAAGDRGRAWAGRRPGHQPAQRPLPDRLHRLQRGAAGARRSAPPTPTSSPPTAGTPPRPRRRRPTSSCSSTAPPCRPWPRGAVRGRRRPAGLRVARGDRRRGTPLCGGCWPRPPAAGPRRAGLDPARGRGAARGQGRRRDRRAAAGLRGRRPGAGRAGRRGGAAAGPHRAAGRPRARRADAGARGRGAVVRDDRRRRRELRDPAPPPGRDGAAPTATS